MRRHFGGLVKFGAACLVAAFMAVGGHSQAALVRTVYIFDTGGDKALTDRWYYEYHSTETIRWWGPWMRRYWAFPSIAQPEAGAKFNLSGYRSTEIWWASEAERLEAAPMYGPITPPPGRETTATPRRIVPTASIHIPAAPTNTFIGGFPPYRPNDAPYLRWAMLVRYPQGVALEEADKWYVETHAPELAKLPGARRFVSARGVNPPNAANPYARLSEMWFDDYPAWEKAALNPELKFTPPPWGGEFPFVEMISILTTDRPDVDFLKGSHLPRP